MQTVFRKFRVFRGLSESVTLPDGGVGTAIAGLAVGWSFIAGVTAGTGVPTFVPVGGAGIYIQTDSNPANRVWKYVNGAWA